MKNMTQHPITQNNPWGHRPDVRHPGLAAPTRPRSSWKVATESIMATSRSPSAVSPQVAETPTGKKIQHRWAFHLKPMCIDLRGCWKGTDATAVLVSQLLPWGSVGLLLPTKATENFPLSPSLVRCVQSPWPCVGRDEEGYGRPFKGFQLNSLFSPVKAKEEQ